jgi:predicted MFS family arabinose efflux permease
VLLAVALIPWYSAMLAVLGVLGLISVAYSTSTNTTLQLSSGEAYRGRILSLYSLMFMGTTPIGGFVTGFLADSLGVTRTVALEACVCLVATLIGMLYLRRARRSHTASEASLAT